jgi:hypothetical protein
MEYGLFSYDLLRDGFRSRGKEIPFGKQGKYKGLTLIVVLGALFGSASL